MIDVNTDINDFFINVDEIAADLGINVALYVPLSLPPPLSLSLLSPLLLLIIKQTDVYSMPWLRDASEWRRTRLA